MHGGFDRGQAGAAGALCALAAELVLLLGGWLGGTVVFVHGERLLGLVEEPTLAAVTPQAIECEPARRSTPRRAASAAGSAGRR